MTNMTVYSALFSEGLAHSYDKALPSLPVAVAADRSAQSESEPIPRTHTVPHYASRPPSYASSSSSSVDSLPTFESLEESITTKESAWTRFASLFRSKPSLPSFSSKSIKSEADACAPPPPYASEEELATMAWRLEQMDALFGGASIKGF